MLSIVQSNAAGDGLSQISVWTNSSGRGERNDHGSPNI